MWKYSMFDRLPTELLHILFDYFSASEIFFTFYNVSERINLTLKDYSSYRLHFQSISKSHFRRVCCNVRPDQVVSLALSDGDQTANQSEVFFQRFRIEQFIHLRSLTLLNIEFNSLQSIFTNLSQLHQIRSLTFDAQSVRHTYGPLDINARYKLEQINTLLCDTYAQLFPRLYFLSLKGGWVLESIPLPELLHLELNQCRIDKLPIITSLAPKLKSLDISITAGYMLDENQLLPSGLIRLKLIISDFPVTHSFIDWLLSNCHRLKHLELHLQGNEDLANGEFWQSLTKPLHTFHFKFHIHFSDINRALDTFRTPFWLVEKCWFVAYQNEYLFSIPYFAPEVHTYYQASVLSTAPDPHIFYEKMTQFTMNNAQIPSLTGQDFVLLTSLSMADLCNIKRLSISSLDDLWKFDPIEQNMPQLSHLIIKTFLQTKSLEQNIQHSYKQIQTLEIGSNLLQYNELINILCRLFPYTEHFIYRPDIQSISLMVQFIDGFTQLSSASFISLGPLHSQDIKYRYHSDLLVLHSRRLTPSISVCRIYHLPDSTSSFGIYWWIEE